MNKETRLLSLEHLSMQIDRCTAQTTMSACDPRAALADIKLVISHNLMRSTIQASVSVTTTGVTQSRRFEIKLLEERQIETLHHKLSVEQLLCCLPHLSRSVVTAFRRLCGAHSDMLAD